MFPSIGHVSSAQSQSAQTVPSVPAPKTRVGVVGAATNNVSSLINNAFTSSLGGSGYRVKWNPDYNSSWILEDSDGISTRTGTQTLFANLLGTKEVIVNPTKPLLSQNAALPDYDFDKPTLVEQKRFLISQLNAQMDLAQAVCLESPFFSLLRKRLLITHRLLYALYSRFHEGLNVREVAPSKLLSASTETDVVVGVASAAAASTNPTEVLMEMGVGVGLNLVFSLLRSNLNQTNVTNNDQTSLLCLDVLEKSKLIVWSLPMMSLANDKKLPLLAVRSLNEVTEFLKQIVTTQSTITKCRVLSAEVILGLALQRCSLQHLLQWIQMALQSSEAESQENELLIPNETLHTTILALHQNSTTNQQSEQLQSILRNCGGAHGIPIHIAAIKLMEELTMLSRIELKGNASPPVTSLPCATSSRSVIDSSFGMFKLCGTGTEETIKLLTYFILTYGLEFSLNSSSPFGSEDERIDFVVLCLQLLNSQLLGLRYSEMNSGLEALVVELRSVCFKMLELELPSKIQKAVAETLSTGGLMLPPLNEKLKLLLTLLKEVKTLSRGQHLLCEIILSSLEDRHRIAQLFGFSRSQKPKDNLTLEELKYTEQLMACLLHTLTEHGGATLAGDVNISQDQDKDMETERCALNVRLHFLLTSLQTHLFSYCVCGAEISCHAHPSHRPSHPSHPHTADLDKTIWNIMKTHLTILFESAIGILKKAEDIVSKDPEAHLRVAGVLYSTIGGSMLLRVLHSMLLPIHHNFHDLLNQLIALLISMESFARKLPEGTELPAPDEYELETGQLNFHACSQDWIWFLDIEKTCSHLVGRLIGDLIRGSHISKEETFTKHWLSSRLFSFGLEKLTLKANISDFSMTLSKLTDNFIGRADDWENQVQMILKTEFPPEIESLFSMILPSATDPHDPDANDNPYELLIEHARSLDWDTCDVEQDNLLDSVIRLVLLAIMKHTGLVNKYRTMSMSQRRQNTKLNEIFSLVFHVRTRLLIVKQNEVMSMSQQPTTTTAETETERSLHAAQSKEGFDGTIFPSVCPASGSSGRYHQVMSQLDELDINNVNAWNSTRFYRPRNPQNPHLRQPEDLIAQFADVFRGENQETSNFVFGRGSQELAHETNEPNELNQQDYNPLISTRPTCTGLSATSQEMAEHIRDNMAFVNFTMNQSNQSSQSSQHSSNIVSSSAGPVQIQMNTMGPQMMPETSRSNQARVSGLETIRQCYGGGRTEAYLQHQQNQHGVSPVSGANSGYQPRQVDIGLPVVSSSTSVANIFLPRQRDPPRSRFCSLGDSRQRDNLHFANSDTNTMVCREHDPTPTFQSQVHGSGTKNTKKAASTMGVGVASGAGLVGQANSYETLTRNIVERSLLLLLFVRSSVVEEKDPSEATAFKPTPFAPFTPSAAASRSKCDETVQLDQFYTDDYESMLPTVKSSDTFRSPESQRHNSTSATLNANNAAGKNRQTQRDGQLLVRKLGRNILRFIGWDLIGSKDWFTETVANTHASSGSGHSGGQSSSSNRDESGHTSADTCSPMDGWSTEPSLVLAALKKHEERARERICALEKIIRLVSPTNANYTNCNNTSSVTSVTSENPESDRSTSNDYLVSVHEFFMAGCFQLGISSPIQISVKPDAVMLIMSNTDTAVCHYLDGVHASPIALQATVIKSVHSIMLWMISTLQSLTASHRSHSQLSRSFSSNSSIAPLNNDNNSRSDDSETEDSQEPPRATNGTNETNESNKRNKTTTRLHANMNTNLKNDEVKLLNLFTLSCRFNAVDVKLVVHSDLLRVLETFTSFRACGGDNRNYQNNQKYLGNTTLYFDKQKQKHGANPTQSQFASYVSMASTRLLHMIAVATSIHAYKLEDEVIEKVVDVLYDQLMGLLKSLCGDYLCTDGDSSPTPTGTPDTPLVSMSPVNADSDSEQQHLSINDNDNELGRKVTSSISPISPIAPIPTSAERLEIEARLGEYLIFLRRLLGEHSMTKFFCKSNWIKLILSFLSVEPCNDVEAFLKLEEDDEFLEEMSTKCSDGTGKQSSANTKDIEHELLHSGHSGEEEGSSAFGVQTTRSIFFSAGLRPRLLAIQFLECLLAYLPTDCSDLKEATSKDLLQQLSDAMWTIPIYERAKKNIFHREEITKQNGELCFDPQKCSCCFTENGGLTLVHGKGGRGFGLASTAFKSGSHHWKFLIVKENKGNEGVCVGVSRWPIRDQNHRSTEDMFLYRAYSGNLYNKGEMPFLLPNYTQGDCITCILDYDNKTISFGKNHDEPILAFQNVEATELYPCVLFYSTNPGEKVKIIDYEPRTNERSLFAGEPFCAPLATTLAESYVSLIRVLHSTNDGWTKAINDALLERVYNAKEILYDSGGDKTPTPAPTTPTRTDEQESLESLECLESAHDAGKCSEEPTGRKAQGLLSFEDIERLCRDIWPVLAVMGGIDRGLRIGLKCTSKTNGKRAFLVGSLRSGSPTVKVQWDDAENAVGDTPVAGLEPIQIPPFDVAKFASISADMIRFLTKLSGITDEIRFPVVDTIDRPPDEPCTGNPNPSHPSGSGSEEDNEEVDEMTIEINLY